MDFLFLVGLIAINGVFAMSELAVVSARKGRLKARADKGDRGAEAALKLQDDPSRFLSTVQIGITLVGVAAGAYGATAVSDDLAPKIAAALPALSARADEIAFALVIVATTFLSLVIGELTPKRIALVAPETIARIVAPPMAFLSRIAFPAVWVLRIVTDGLIAALGLARVRKDQVTEEEIHTIIEEGASSGAIEDEERVMMRGVMRLADRDVRSIMTPRPEIVWIDADDPLELQLDEMRASGHSRFPVARGDLEHVVGVVQTKDLLARAGATAKIDIAAAAKPATIVPDTLSVMTLLEAIKDNPVRMALIVDEHGDIQGLVTPADLLSAIAGMGAYAPDDGLAAPFRRDDGSWLVDGLTPIDDLETALGLTGLGDDAGRYTTLAGLIMHELQKLPTAGDRVEAKGLKFEVVDMDGRRIDKVLVREAPGDG